MAYAERVLKELSNTLFRGAVGISLGSQFMRRFVENC